MQRLSKSHTHHLQTTEHIRRTLARFNAFHEFIVNSTSPLLDELVALDTKIDDLCPLDAECD